MRVQKNTSLLRVQPRQPKGLPFPPSLHVRNVGWPEPLTRLILFLFRYTPFAMATPSDSTSFLREAIELAVENVEAGLGGPFAALVVEDGSVLATGTNRVTTIQDPTAHAEITAIRAACKERDHFELDGCTLYCTCEPCPMCLGAIYWARLDRVVYAATQADAAEAGFDDEHIYQEIDTAPTDRRIPMRQQLAEEAQRPFEAWRDYEDRVEY